MKLIYLLSIFNEANYQLKLNDIYDNILTNIFQGVFLTFLLVSRRR